jgi:hypothetical protein
MQTSSGKNRKTLAGNTKDVFRGKFLKLLYSEGVIPKVALEISAVKIA